MKAKVKAFSFFSSKTISVCYRFPWAKLNINCTMILYFENVTYLFALHQAYILKHDNDTLKAARIFLGESTCRVLAHLHRFRK